MTSVSSRVPPRCARSALQSHPHSHSFVHTLSVFHFTLVHTLSSLPYHRRHSPAIMPMATRSIIPPLPHPAPPTPDPSTLGPHPHPHPTPPLACPLPLKPSLFWRITCDKVDGHQVVPPLPGDDDVRIPVCACAWVCVCVCVCVCACMRA